jgi:hypothetical protein
MKYRNAAGWQKDSANLKTDKVQYWTSSGTMLGVYDRAVVAEKVDNGDAFVVSDQAAADYEDRYATYND